MRGPAPNFSGEYPGRGARIGPAWRDIWREFNRGCWAHGGDLAELVAPRHDLQVSTVKNLLYSATRAGVLERKLDHRPGHKGPGRRQVFYRVRQR